MRHAGEAKQHDHRTLIQKVFGYCPSCGKWLRTVRTCRQNTSYADDEKNFFTGCKPCEEENDRYWDEMWADYYRSCL